MHQLIKNFFTDCESISKYYRYLVTKTKNHENVGIASEWLIDNYYLVVEYRKNIEKDKVILSKMLKVSKPLYNLLNEIVVNNEYHIHYKSLIKEINSYQKKNHVYFTYKEFSLLQVLLYFIYTKKLNSVLCNVCNDLEMEELVKYKIATFDIDNRNKSFAILKDEKLLKNDTYIFEVNRQLKEMGTRSNLFFKELTKLLEENKKSLKDIVSDKYQEKMHNTMIISNIFTNLKDIMIYDIETIFQQMNFCEKTLMEDSIYSKMTPETKETYRIKLSKLARKKHKEEKQIAEELLKESEEKNIHIGNILFKNISITGRTISYIFSILFLSFLLAFFLSGYFISYRFIGFLILLVPSISLVTQIVHQALMIFVKPTPLFKMDYLKEIPKDSKCMVVIPTIISDTEKIKNVFDRLETYYLMNKSSNLYFTLLGDAKKEDSEIMPYDKEIIDFGVEYSKKLNKKYKKELFHFVYRKRIWSEDEDAFLGYERKRGALLHFNQLLLKRTTKSFEKKYFSVHTLENFNEDIKYVITLDTDTEPVLNSLLKLVGCIAHPLNKPVLNDKKNKVISGYGMIQPKVSTDIEATNQSLFSQIFAGIGGFDTYSSLSPNIYQDVFNEGNFVGKGIYDLEVYNQVLYERFPENLILSHDLLEGNYLRCGYASDIEIVDGFPSSFLVEASRNHRWARGDTQIISYLLNTVKTSDGVEKNPLTLLEKYKILDNIIRMFTYPSLLLITILMAFLKEYQILFFFFLLLVIAFPILTFLRSKLYVKRDKTTTVYYKDLVYGGKALVLRTITVFATIPYYTKLYIDAFSRSMYRIFYSHKNLLSWTSSEEATKVIPKSFVGYVREFFPQLILSILLFLSSLLFQSGVGIIISIVFLVAPALTYYISRDLTTDTVKKEVNSNIDEEFYSIAKKTWDYFSTYLKEEYFYLIPDNYQETREEKIVYRTSPTNIGYSLTSVISAYFLGFINIDECIHYLREIVSTIDSLEKWNGHLYNWYQIETKQVLLPRFVSSIDSGNLVAALTVAMEFLRENEQEELVLKIESIIDKTNFKKLYTKKDVISIGFDVDRNQLSMYHYNRFASESRLTSFIAICKGDIPSKHWFCLDKTLTTYKRYKGLVSWSGTAFEYYMPLLFMKNYQNTLLDETYQFAHICQKSYIESIDKRLPYGISESAFSELDQGLNYKYKSFSVPYLTSKEEMVDKIVISPYSSMMEAELFPQDVYKNIGKFKKLNMIFKYGFYDAYDYDSKKVVRACYSHHQGMILMGLTNYLKNNILKDYFHSNVRIKAFETLLKEKVQVRANIDMKMEKYKKYNYEKEKLENDIRFFNYISNMPEVSILSNKKYMLLMNDRGSGFSRYRTLQLNRYRKITEQDYGMYLYIKDLDTNKIWSNTYAPINQKPDKYEVVFASDKIKFFRRDGMIGTKTEVIVLEEEQAEVRKITFYNDSEELKNLELTTYTEPILSENREDVAHKVYNQMFLETEWDSTLKALIAKRKGKNNEAPSYMANALLLGDEVEDYDYETNRFSFVGRNHSYHNPVALSKPLSNHVGSNIEPILSIRGKIKVLPHRKKIVYFINCYGRSKKQLEDILNRYREKKQIDKAFKISNLASIATTKRLNITGEDMRLYHTILNYIYQTTSISISENRREILSRNSLQQNGLWKFGISGDHPMIVVNIKDLTNLTFVMEILKAFEYFKNKSIFIDIIIINSEIEEYALQVKKEIDNELYRMYALNSFYHTPGSVFVLEKKEISSEEMILFQVTARLYFDVDKDGSLQDEVIKLQKKNKINDYQEIEILESNIENKKNHLEYDNSYGGFQKNGSEYFIYQPNTPTPWANIIANEKFGTIITNNGCGYTFFENSLEYKLTSWTNEMVINDKSEGMKLDGKIIDFSHCTHGFGYSVLESAQEGIKTSLTEFIPKEESVKLYLLEMENKEKEDRDVSLSFYINPTLGNFEEKTSRHILSEMIEEDNYLKLRNVYHSSYSDVCVFLSSSEKIVSSILHKILVKEITIHVSLKASEKKQIVFMMGCSRDDAEMKGMIEKYRNIDSVVNALEDVKKDWKNKLSTITVETKDKSFDYMMNGWYLYQAISSRILAKAGFYQVSGAFGYRDQLQDAMNLCAVLPENTKRQIIINASHQFRMGDVLHWWHEKTHFGLRSRYKDDYLWLVYATIHYIKMTKDYSILEEEVPYIEGEELTKHEIDRGIHFHYSLDKEPLFEHLLLSLNYAMNQLGTHGLPLMGGGDWNDGMNKVGIKGKGESVWLGFFLYMLIEDMVPIMNHYSSEIDTSYYKDFNKDLKTNLNTYGFENGYYLRAYFDNGDKLGSIDSKECKIDLISQSFAILSGVCEENIDTVIEKVEQELVDKDLNIIKLLSPPFKDSLNDPGYIMNYPKGIRENGGQYTHAVSWYIMALIKAKKYDLAYQYFQMINPVNRATNQQGVETYQVEPYVIAADIYSNDSFQARGGWTWYTGSAAWFYRVGIEELLGIKREGNQLKIEPHLSTNNLNYHVHYQYQDALYDIKVKHGTKDKIVMNHKTLKTDYIPLEENGNYQVEVFRIGE